jgi:hypothetical protein
MMPEFKEVKDSGKREEFKTGSVRDTQVGKGRYDLIPPISLRRLAQHYENGARKYGDRNWEKGQPLSRYLNSALRHLQNILEGDTSEDHMAAGAWNLFAIIHTQEMIHRGALPKELDDLPKPPMIYEIKNAEVSIDGAKMLATDIKLEVPHQEQLIQHTVELHARGKNV